MSTAGPHAGDAASPDDGEPGSGEPPEPGSDDEADEADDAEPPDDPDEEDDEDEGDDEGDDYGPPFVRRSFGGEFVWARGGGFTCKILRVRPGENVIVSTQGRKDMFAMLTGGRGVLEVHDGDATDRVELLPGSPIPIRPGQDYRLLALTEVELYTVYSPA